MCVCVCFVILASEWCNATYYASVSIISSVVFNLNTIV